LWANQPIRIVQTLGKKHLFEKTKKEWGESPLCPLLVASKFLEVRFNEGPEIVRKGERGNLVCRGALGYVLQTRNRLKEMGVTSDSQED